MKEESEIKARLYLLANCLGVTPNEFSIRIGKDRTYLSKVSKEIQTDVLRNIFITFPSVNILWIITGEGEVLTQKADEALQSNDTSLLLRMLNKEVEKVEKLQNKMDELLCENKELLKEKVSLQENVYRLNLENIQLKQRLEMETSPSSKAI